MPIPALHRKTLFKTTIELSGTTVRAWAGAQDVSHTHLYLVLDGRRESAKLTEEVDRFIARVLRENRRVLELAS